ncbi:MAG: hypothetical protein KJ728_10910 [Alphaproteobacteria bacterium]|jgi:hypothetical protein|nr:hypothetical protein [Brevundimonas sp. EAKA]MBU1270698.1 hypothetical protein [Alphaproteobacteria bacterium]OGN41291.1 MAG: hypothetical protein A2093_10685 [Caulobacterales bacterium GWE1_67_11]OGN44026.1 MAG: hypothetical protein A2795_03645 [Caulobacterales bacterium RIFCSPHIGHO2_01_FULL_67_30]OGN46174.1 MAG: hypothetical protein A3E24_01215 [Caulobacterales bacterium RIFCSPHIGHO2_12_FULL_68_13]KDP93478.1 hypothetical protein ER13_01090 [Brevundimonas sp. EAKA]
MTTRSKLRHGALAWFEMVGAVMTEAAVRSGLAADLNVSLVERYTDGAEIGEGLVQGLRFDIRDGKPGFRAGARPDERADITIEITAAGARALNLLYGDDPEYALLLDRLLSIGEMRIEGDPSQLGDWLKAVHDPIVDRTI